jgi:hypothetical protein
MIPEPEEWSLSLALPLKRFARSDWLKPPRKPIWQIYVSLVLEGGNKTATPKRLLIVKLGIGCYNSPRFVTWL